jgi:hypothetical protein
MAFQEIAKPIIWLKRSFLDRLFEEQMELKIEAVSSKTRKTEFLFDVQKTQKPNEKF